MGLNPVNPAAAIALTDGAVTIPDQDTIGTLFVAGRYGKFVLFDIDTDTPGVYFMNTHTHPAHQSFLDAVGLEGSKVILGQIDYDPNLVAPDGSLGVYYYYYWLSLAEYSFSYGALFYTLLAARMPLLEDNLALYVTNAILPHYQDEWALYKASRINVLFDEDIYPETRRFLALNPGEGYGRLQVLDPADRPHPRDIVLYEALPNELPRVAGIISTVPQTPLSHVNLRAVQDGIPNAFIRDARDDPTITPLIGGFVRYEVTESGYSIRAATPEAGLLDRQDIFTGDLELDLHGERFSGCGVVQPLEVGMDHGKVVPPLIQVRVAHQKFSRLHQVGGGKDDGAVLAQQEFLWCRVGLGIGDQILTELRVDVCVQQRLACSVGDRPTGVEVRAP